MLNGMMTDSSSNAVLGIFRANAILEERFTGALSAVHGLALKELLLMLYVQRAPGSKLSRVDLAKRLHVNPSTVTRMTLPLEKIGMIAREADARDARLAYVTLTPSGEERLNEAFATLNRMSADVFQDRWSEEDIEGFDSLLQRIAPHSYS